MGRKDKGTWKVVEPMEFSSNKFLMFYLSKLAGERNGASKQKAWRQPQDQSGLGTVYTWKANYFD